MTTLNTSYIDTKDLEECLQMFYTGTFDDCDQYLDRLYKGLPNLHPSNSLFGQLDSAELEEAISSLCLLHQAVIENKFSAEPKSNSILTRSYYQNEQQTTFEAWLGLTYLEAIEELSNEVMALL